MSHDIQQTEGRRRATIDGKPVVSHLLPQDSEPPAHFPVDGIQRAIYMAFSTRFDGKTIITGCGVGRINGDTRNDIELTDVGNAALKVVGAHCENLFFCECRNVSTAKQRAVAALKAAKDGSGVFIVCKNSEIYDEVNLIRLFGVEKMGSGAPLPADFYETSVSDPHLNLKMADVPKTTLTAPSDGLRPLSLGEVRRELTEKSESDFRRRHAPSATLEALLSISREAKAGRLFVIESLPHALVKERLDEAADAVRSGVLRAPFHITSVLMTYGDDGGIYLLRFVDSGFVDDEARGYGLRALITSPHLDSSGELWWKIPPSEEEAGAYEFYHVILSLIADSRSSVTRIAADDKLNKARVKRGKAPIPSYWKIEPPKPTILIPNAAPTVASKSKGATHASPKPHDRRGHPRHLKKGDRTIWVRECRINALLPHLTRGRLFYEVKLAPKQREKEPAP
jgi:hypothetical protein